MKHLRPLYLLLPVLLVSAACGGGGGGELPEAWSDCCNSDSPLCPGFDPTGAWDPSPGIIQDVALSTLDTACSCVADGGKPFYQMRLGLNSPDSAQVFACALVDLAAYIPAGFGVREAWCSEAISYWHREAQIPYPTGYRNSTWLLDWQLTNTGAIKLFYETEESIGGRGRWLHWDEVDYSDYQPGITVPVPGSYVLIRNYDDTTSPPSWAGNSHSMMIDEMTVYVTAFGEVDRIEATILEGNSGARVRNTRVIDDLRDVTPAGDDFLGSRKILGFGVDLDASGQPVYDTSRLHVVTVSAGRPFPERIPDPSDLWWKAWCGPLVPEIAAYARLVRENQGARVLSSVKEIPLHGVPDGLHTRWTFPEDVDQQAPQGFEVEIDLLDVHPLSVARLFLLWSGTELPQGYRVLYADGTREYRDAFVPDLEEGAMTFTQDGRAAMPVPVSLGTEGALVRYVKLSFPPGSLRGVKALEDLRFEFVWGPGFEDAEKNP